MRRHDRRSIDIRIENLTEAQAIALQDLLATWVQLGEIGGSRWTAFYADGDGNFRPKIMVNGEKPSHTGYVTNQERWHCSKTSEEMYWMDFDRIAWALRARDGE